MKKSTIVRIELNYEDRIAIENAIWDKIEALNRIIENKDAGFRDIEEGITERKRLGEIYHAMRFCRGMVRSMTIERDFDGDA